MVDAGWAHDLVTGLVKGAAQLALIIMKMDSEMAALMMIVKVDNFDRHISHPTSFSRQPPLYTKTSLHLDLLEILGFIQLPSPDGLPSSAFLAAYQINHPTPSLLISSVDPTHLHIGSINRKLTIDGVI